jgi:anti-sigma factor RsiW
MAALTCQEMVELVTNYLEGKLSRRDRRRVAKHLAVCNPCARYVAQMRETLDLLGTVPVNTLSPEAQSTLLDAFRNLKR